MDNQSLTVKEYCIQQGFSDRVIEEGIPFLIERWEKTAERIADYRHWCKDDYLNDLDVRQILSEIMPLAPAKERSNFESQLALADVGFVANSVASPSCLWGAAAETNHQWIPHQNWWYYRMPKLIGPDF